MLERLVARNFRALDRKDLRTFMRGWADDAVFEFPGHSAISGRFVGKSAIEAWWRRWFARMEAVHFAVKRVGLANPFTLSIVNTVFVEWTADVTTKDGLSAHAEAVSVMCIRRGKVWLARDYFLDPAVEDQVWGTTCDGDVAGSAPEEPPILVGAPRTDRTAEPAVVS